MVQITKVETSPIAGQKTGTSGLRKKVSVFRSKNYLENWVQSLFNSLQPQLTGSTLVVGGDGRFYNINAIQLIIKLAAANGVSKLLIGQNGILSTPAVSSIIRETKSFGGIILTASHNPGGENADFGIKYNTSNGGPAPESITDRIFVETESISFYQIADIPEVDLSKLNSFKFEEFEVEVIDSVDIYEKTLKSVFDFQQISTLLSRPDFNLVLDSLSGVTGVYTQRLFASFGISSDGSGDRKSRLLNATPLEDFGGHHPDPNLTYAADLVTLVNSEHFDFGAAFDGDGDRNMIVSDHFFVNPSDSVAIIAANAEMTIPYFRAGLGAVARSMPTSAALDLVARKKGIDFFEVPTGWKFFGNIMDAYSQSGSRVICGEESFGTSSDHIREKDGIWAALAWLSIIAHVNKDTKVGDLVTIEKIVRSHWAEYGRNYYSRHDYEEVSAEKANEMMVHIAYQLPSLPTLRFGHLEIATADDFSYQDRFDNSVTKGQGYRIIFTDGSRIIFRLSGTGSSGATIRLYLEKYVSPEGDQSVDDTQIVLRDLIDIAEKISKLKEFTGRNAPTVIT